MRVNQATTSEAAELDNKLSRKQFDLFLTVLRRKYIPPMMECYQDIIVECRKFHSSFEQDLMLAKLDKFKL